MATLRDIRNRIKAVKNTQKITKAMKMVAAAKLRRAQEAIINARPYAKGIKQLLTHVLAVNKDFSNPLTDVRNVNNVAVLLITYDKGLCGSFNTNVIKEVNRLLNEELKEYVNKSSVKFYVVGKKGYDIYSFQNVNIERFYTHIFLPRLEYKTAKNILENVKNDYLNGVFDELYVVYNEFKNVIQQKVVVERLLPIKITNQFDELENIDYIYEPDKNLLLEKLIPEYLDTEFWRIMLESQAAVFAAQMTAMDNATENAKEIISQLQLNYNKARQAAITKELLEVVSGANALNG
ncbi:MAG TPA: ATP synthase F1 subunit gamma [Ignavibacteriales bacterium]|nr:ATP synthase F1 subunit gamma [Ignavibacteriales bacterium]HOL82177.1 ATP synthase F1 subunit gamma [Ignavibacteriales bacterium]HOM65757.1 ATP synthase F1 subunit gamma [Ignavibacteriales bacterium]HPD67612.1 ATP synthase F1 subunit gamma [Ignavibacteriales bacterium]HPP34305.1 ATP synthase F1 subunit gamma [Ignavibacteriales bacterium]